MAVAPEHGGGERTAAARAWTALPATVVIGLGALALGWTPAAGAETVVRQAAVAATTVSYAEARPAAPPPSTVTETLSLSSLLALSRDGEVRTALVDTANDTVSGSIVRGGHTRAYQASFPAGFGPHLTDLLLADRVSVTAAAVAASSQASASSALWLFVVLLLVMAAVFGVGAVRRRRAGGAASGGLRAQSPSNPAGFTKGRGEQVQVPSTRFADVAGVDEAIDDFRELVAYLQDPEPFKAAGADLPHGYLLAGPPGTGKTLLARAVAGEAGVPFFAIGASEFVESYVGVGAARVRSLFDRARSVPAAIVFVDELDAIGRSRSAHAVPGNEERESTLNQLLVEMDGFGGTGSVVVLAATNRPDILDAALLRPGRFDRQIAVPVPDRLGRARILGLYLQRRSVADDVDVQALSRRTSGFTGADLANLVNTSALLAVRAGTGVVTTAMLDEALATVALGPARTSAVVAVEDRRITAWHETGHALVGLWLKDADDPISISIVPRGPAGGVTWFPGHDAPFMTRRQAKAQLAVSMAGRAAEELLLGDDFTQGGAQDFRAATDLARRMVTEYGMGSIGPGYVPPEETHIGVLAERVHDATEELLDEALATARALLAPARATVERVVARLLEEETIDAATLSALAGSASAARPSSGVRALRLSQEGAA